MLTIDIERTGDVTVVRCSGRIVRGEEVRTLSNAVMSQKNIRIAVLDLSDIEMLDAGGLTALLSLHRWASEQRVQLKLVNPSHFVYEVLERTGLNRVFDISTFDHALAVLCSPQCHHVPVGQQMLAIAP